MNRAIRGLVFLFGMLATCGAAVENTVSLHFIVPSTVVTTNVATNKISLAGRFWTEWIVETNDIPRVAMQGFDNKWWLLPTGTIFLGDQTNYLAGPSINIENWNADSLKRMWECQKEHVDRSEYQDISYVSSNLISFLVWRGQTNRQYLETIPVTNIVKRWRYEMRKTPIP